MSREIYGLLIGVFTLLTVSLPTQIFLLAVAFLSFLMARELERTLRVEGVSIASFFLLISYFYNPALGGILNAVFALIYGYKSWSLDVFFRTMFILFYTAFFPSYLVHLREEGILVLLTLILAIWTNDVLAYYVGKNFGRTPLFPQLSPKKTLEGFTAGLIGGTLVVLLLLKAPLLDKVLIGVITLCAGVAGDYFKSFIKRQVGIKDFSNVLGGHGGFVDRFDALVFSAPVFYLLLRG